MSNIWNRIIYLLWAPVYDFILERFFERGRRRAIELASLKPNQRVLLSGVGTGQDLALLPGDVRITGIDLSKQKARRVSADDFKSVTAAMRTCPSPKNPKCRCRAHRKLGRRDRNGRWNGLQDMTLEDSFPIF